MIALTASLFLLFYLLVPAGIFRFATSLAVPLKKFHKTKAQEFSFAVAACFLPFWLAMWLVWTVAAWPFPTRESSQQRRQAYRIVYSSLNSDKALDAAVSNGTFWPAANSALRRQTRFLVWYYAVVCLEAGIFCWLAFRYSRFRKKRIYNFFAEHLLLPGISEWHVILTDFAIPSDLKREIEVDILSTENILYQGQVSEYFLNLEGELSGILLSRARRFDRDAYMAHKNADLQAASQSGTVAIEKKFTKAKEDYWSTIPGADLFYVPRERISNLNVRHVTPAVTEAARARLEDRGIKAMTIQEVPAEKAIGEGAGN
jgi:hypothetical protein